MSIPENILKEESETKEFSRWFERILTSCCDTEACIRLFAAIPEGIDFRVTEDFSGEGDGGKVINVWVRPVDFDTIC